MISDAGQRIDELTPLSEQDEVDVVRVINKRDRSSGDRHGKWRTETRESYDFLAGHQWDATDMEILNDQGRPPITFNQIATFFNVVAGSQVNNRQETSFNATRQDTEDKAEILGQIADWCLDRADVEDEDTSAFHDLLTCGMGWSESFMSYDEDPQGKYECERINPLNMRWDPNAQKRNLADAMWFLRRERKHPQQIEARWPGSLDKIQGAEGIDASNANEPSEPHRDAYSAEDDGLPEDEENGLIVKTMEWWESEPAYVVVNPYGATEDLSKDEFDTLKKRLKEAGQPMPRYTSRPRKLWWRATICGAALLEGPQLAPVDRMSSFRPMTGYFDQRDCSFYGIIRAMKDPQRWCNKWLSQSIHIINTGAKSGWIAEKGAISDIRAFEEDVAKAGTVQIVEPGALANERLREKTPPAFPAAWQQLLQFAIDSIPAVSGINNEIRGQIDHEQSGVVEWQRKQAATTILAPLFNSLRRYYKERGRLLLYFITQYIPPNRAIRIVGPEQQPMVVTTALIGDPDGYDIEVDEAPTSPNQKTQVWLALQQLLPTLVQMGLPMQMWLELLDYFPLPKSVSDNLKEIAKQTPPQPDPKQAEMQMKLQQSQMEMQLAQQKAQADMALANQKAEHDALLQRQKAILDMQIEAQRAQADMEIEATRARMQGHIQVQDAQVKHGINLHQSAVDADVKKKELDLTASAHHKAMGDNVDKLVQKAIGPLQKHVENLHSNLTDMQKGHREAISGLQKELRRPKKIVRDKSGRISAVEPA